MLDGGEGGLVSKDRFGEQLPIPTWREKRCVVALALAASWEKLAPPLFFSPWHWAKRRRSIRQVPTCHLLALPRFLVLLLLLLMLLLLLDSSYVFVIRFTHPDKI